MAYENLKSAIKQAIKNNNNQEITGDLLQSTLLNIVNTIGADYKFLGFASPSTVPPTNEEGRLFYFASAAGEYINFPTTGENTRIVTGEGLYLFTKEANSNYWKEETLIGIVQELGEAEDKVMSQKVASNKLNDLSLKINGEYSNNISSNLQIGWYNGETGTRTENVNYRCKKIAVKKGDIIKYEGKDIVFIYAYKNNNLVGENLKNYIYKRDSYTIVDDIDCLWFTWEVANANNNIIKFLTRGLLDRVNATEKSIEKNESDITTNTAQINAINKYINGNNLGWNFVGEEFNNTVFDYAFYTTPISVDCIIRKITIFSYGASVRLATINYSKDSGYTIDKEYLYTVADTAYQEVAVNVEIKAGQYLGIKSVKYNGKSDTPQFTLITHPGNRWTGLAFSFSIDGIDKEIKNIKNDINTIKDTIDIIASDSNYLYTELYRSNDFSDWKDYDKDNRGTWSKNDNSMTPTAIGGYFKQSDGYYYLCGAICLAGMSYEGAFKKCRIEAILGSDSILNIHCVRSNVTGVGNTGESFFVVDCKSKKLKMNASDNSYTKITDVEYISSNITFDLVSGRKYLIDIIKEDCTSKLVVTDSISGESSSLSYTGWGVGTQQNQYALSWGGGTAPIISKVVIKEPTNLDYLIIGDSNSEGYGVSGESFAKMAEKYLMSIGRSAMVSACGGDTILQIIWRFNVEILKNKPKNIICTIGTNVPSDNKMLEYYTQLVNLCTNNNINLILNHIPCGSGIMSRVVEMNGYIDSFNLPSAKFDIATALNGDISQGRDDNLYNDTLHLNYKGHKKLYGVLKQEILY